LTSGCWFLQLGIKHLLVFGWQDACKI